MARIRIAVEDSLQPFGDRLAAAGYEVVALQPGAPRPADVAAVVVNGLDEDVTGDEKVAIAAPIIDAAGRTPEQVLARIRSLPVP